jgi:hypothetical protein
MVYQTGTSVSNLPCIELIKGNPAHHHFLRHCVTIQWMDDPAYKLKSMAGAFLQGGLYPNRVDLSWTLVEFWTPNYQSFIDWMNQQVQENTSYYQNVVSHLDL